jgi:hypothetical protein
MEEEFFPLLPVGIHILTEPELKKICVDDFPESLSRPEIYAGVLKVLDRLRISKVEGYLWVNGSLITEKPEPNDADLLLVIPRLQYEQFNDDAKAALTWFISEEIKELRCDAYTLVYESVTEWETKKSKQQWRAHWNYCHWVRQFGQSRSRSSKGIACVKIQESNLHGTSF